MEIVRDFLDATRLSFDAWPGFFCVVFGRWIVIFTATKVWKNASGEADFAIVFRL